MKKIYLSLCGIAISTTILAQHKLDNIEAVEAYQAPMKGENFKPLNTYSFFQGKASGDTIFYESFGEGLDGDPGNGAWTTGGATDIWEVRTVGPQGQFASTDDQTIQSTTAANGFAIFDADQNQSPSPDGGFFDHIGYIESPAIDLTGYTELSVSFQQAYRHCCAGGFQFLLQLSDDDFATHDNFVVNTPFVRVNTFSGTDMRLTDISSFIAGATDLTNVKMRFLFDGTGGTSHYFWQIDDISIIESLENNMSMSEYFLGHGTFQYPAHYFPEHQITPISFSALVENKGINTQNEVTLNATATANGDVEAVLTSAPISTEPGDIDSLATTSTWTPQGGAGTAYELDFLVAQTEDEQFPFNNVISDIFEITDTVFGVDNNRFTGSFTNFASQPQSGVKIGNIIEIPNNTYITSLSIYISNIPDADGQQFFGELRFFDEASGTYEFLDETAIVEITSADLGGFVTLKLNSPVEVSAGLDLLVLAGHLGSGNANIRDVGFGMSKRVPQGSVLGYDASDGLVQLLDPRAIMIRANMNPNVSVDELAKGDLKVSNSFPNPFSEKTTVEYTLETASKVAYELVDMAGRSILSVDEGMVAAGGHKIQIDGAGLSNGVYHLNISTSNGQVSRKLVVNK